MHSRTDRQETKKKLGIKCEPAVQIADCKRYQNSSSWPLRSTRQSYQTHKPSNAVILERFPELFVLLDSILFLEFSSNAILSRIQHKALREPESYWILPEFLKQWTSRIFIRIDYEKKIKDWRNKDEVNKSVSIFQNFNLRRYQIEYVH